MTAIAASVLATVNAPYRRQLDAQQLAYYLENHAAARTVAGHMSTFFGEVATEMQMAFAQQFGISKPELVAAARAFAQYSGESYALVA